MKTLGSSAEHLAKAAYLLFENCYTPVVAGISFFTVALVVVLTTLAPCTKFGNVRSKMHNSHSTSFPEAAQMWFPS